MKFRFAAILLCTVMLVSCGKTAELSETSGVGRYTEIGDRSQPVDVQFEASYTRTDGYIEKKTYPYVTVLNTRSELEKYTADHEGQYNFYETSQSKGFYDLVTQYDAVYFADNSLVMIMLEEGSGSISHRVKSITNKNGETTIEIERNVPAECTDDMAEWHVVVELPKGSPVLENPEEIAVKFVNITE